MEKFRLLIAICWKHLGNLYSRYTLLDEKIIISRNVSGIKHVKFGGNNSVGKGTEFSGSIYLGAFSTLGSYSTFVGPITIGNYCQFGSAVGIYGSEHPSSFFSINVNKNLFNGLLKKHSIVDKVEIGNDVWVGHGAVILKGVEIGNGAIVGAGSVVTNSLPPYSIAVGNPAHVIKYRFPDEIINLLEELQWWNIKQEELEIDKDLLAINILDNYDIAKRNLTHLIQKHRK